MRKSHHLLILVLLALWTTAPANAQSYAPETRFHDMAQRHYVVELARVLADIENQKKPGIAEVTYALVGEPDGASAWDLKWLDAQGAVIREFQVKYPAELLLKGPEFYREVLRQMKWVGSLPGDSLGADQLAAEYWSGMERAGTSRSASLESAFELQKSSLGSRQKGAQLAGLLTQSALSVLSTGVTLDRVLLARGAAWLAVSESQLKDASAAQSALWSPLLFLVGRENAAAQFWKNPAAEQSGAVSECWGYLFTQPKLRDAFCFVSKPEHRRFMFPVINYFCRRDGFTFNWEDVFAKLGSPEEVMSLYHDHLPAATDIGSVSTGNLLSDSAAAAREAWLECLRKTAPSPLDFNGYQEELKKQGGIVVFFRSLLKELNEPEGEESLRTLDKAAKLINLGQTEGVGKLIPVSTATVRDLLNYGWETTGIQIGSRHDFIDSKWGQHKAAEELATAVKAKVSGLDLFFLAKASDATPAMLAGADRFQEVPSVAHSLEGSKPWYKQITANPEAFASRNWLVPEQVRMACSIYYHGKKRGQIIPYIKRVRAEGGGFCDGYLGLWFADDLREDGMARVPGAKEYKEQFALERKAKGMDPSTLDMLDRDFEKLPALEQARQYEGYFWNDDCAGMHGDIFNLYITAHAYDSAKRFYTQVEPEIEAVTFSVNLGPRRQVLAYLEKDEAAMAEVLVASRTASYSNYSMQVLDAASKGYFNAMAKFVDQCIEHYGEGKEIVLLKGFLPLLPALGDPANPEHEKALDYFKKSPEWIALQWVLADQANLSPEERIRFFGGLDTDWERKLVVLAIKGDKEAFENNYAERGKTWRVTGHMWTASVLLHHLRNELLSIPVPADQGDLRPADAMPLAQRVLKAM